MHLILNHFSINQCVEMTLLFFLIKFIIPFLLIISHCSGQVVKEAHLFSREKSLTSCSNITLPSFSIAVLVIFANPNKRCFFYLTLLKEVTSHGSLERVASLWDVSEQLGGVCSVLAADSQRRRHR